MLGTIVNTCTILLGSAFGAVVKSRIGGRYRTALFDALGLACLVLGANASLSSMPKSEYPVLFIVSLVIGTVIGTRCDFSGKLERLQERIASKGTSSESKSPGLLEGLTTALLLFCIGTFSIVGPFISYLSPSHGWSFNEAGNTFLYTNATLDMVTSAIMAAVYGWGMMLAAPVLFCWQGMFYLIACCFGDVMSESLQAEICIVGGILIISSGLAILKIKDCKTVNMLPSLLVPVVFYLLKWMF